VRGLAWGHRDPVFLEQFLSLIFVKIHNNLAANNRWSEF
jgi:hypothetical protein